MEIEIALIAALTVIASTIGTFTGFGISTIMVPFLVLFYPLPQTLLLVGIIHWFGDAWKLILFRKGIRWRLLVAFGLPGVVASFLGAEISLSYSAEALSRIMGAFLIAYVLYLYSNPSFHLPQKMALAAAGGASSGLMAGAFGIGGEIRGVFLSAFDLDKDVYLATAGAIAMAIDSARIATYVNGGTRLEPLLFTGLMAFIPASLLGAIAAKSLVKKVPQNRFRAAVAAFLFLIGVKLLIFP